MRIDTFTAENNDWAKLAAEGRRAESLGVDGNVAVSGPSVSGRRCSDASV